MDGEDCPSQLAEIYEHWRLGDFTRRFEVYADEYEWGFSDEFPEAYVGPDRAARSERLHAWLSPWRDWRCFPEGYVERDRRVVVFARYTGTAKRSGLEVDQKGAHVWTLDGAKVVRLEIYADRERALAAVGIARDEFPARAVPD
jgi:ketosteroid isomerase-like protein